MECVRCGEHLGEAQAVCPACQLDTATIDRSPDGRTHPVYERYIAIRRACHDVASGALALDAFAELVEGLAHKMARTERDIREVEIPPEVIDSVREELEAGFRGIALYNEAMTQLRLYVSSPAPEHLKAALQCAWQGNESINEARRLNRQQRDPHDEALV